jgi:hypothetical protein
MFVLGHVYVCARSILPLSTIVLLDFKTVPTVWYILLKYHLLNAKQH